MTKEKFCEQLRERLDARYGALGYKVRILKEGYTSENQKELELIKNTNLKYYHNQEETLGGDIIILENQDNSYVRQEIDYLIKLFNEEGWECLKTVFDKNIALFKYTDTIKDVISNFDCMKDKIIVRLLNYERNEAELEGNAYRKIGNLAIVLYILVLSNNYETFSFKVSKEILKVWGISEDKVIEIGLLNTKRLFPPRVYGVEYLFTKREPKPEDGDYMNTSQKIKLGDLGEDVFVALGTQNGATSFFYPGVKEKIAEMLGGESYYVVFTSTEDFHVHRCSKNDALCLEKRLEDINNNFSLGEMLTERIYKYNVDTGEFTEVDTCRYNNTQYK